MDVAYKGVELFLCAKRLVLTQQMRSAEDAQWATWMRAMRDLTVERPFSPDLLAQLQQQMLTAGDRTLSCWLFARGGGVSQVCIMPTVPPGTCCLYRLY